MSNFLKSLTIADPAVKQDKSTLETAKDNLVENLKQQHAAAQAMLKGEEYTVERTETVEVDGEKTQRTVQRPIRLWFFKADDGTMRLNLRYANKRFELEKGKPDIVVKAAKDLPSVINTVIKAVEAGELDKPLITQIVEREKARAAKDK